VPADEPEETIRAVRGRRAAGRHRTDRPGAAPQPPDAGFPVRRPDAPRRSRRRGASAHHAPEAPAHDAFADWYGGGAWEGGDPSGGWPAVERPDPEQVAGGWDLADWPPPAEPSPGGGADRDADEGEGATAQPGRRSRRRAAERRQADDPQEALDPDGSPYGGDQQGVGPARTQQRRVDHRAEADPEEAAWYGRPAPPSTPDARGAGEAAPTRGRAPGRQRPSAEPRADAPVGADDLFGAPADTGAEPPAAPSGPARAAPGVGTRPEAPLGEADWFGEHPDTGAEPPAARSGPTRARQPRVDPAGEHDVDHAGWYGPPDAGPAADGGAARPRRAAHPPPADAHSDARGTGPPSRYAAAEPGPAAGPAPPSARGRAAGPQRPGGDPQADAPVGEADRYGGAPDGPAAEPGRRSPDAPTAGRGPARSRRPRLDGGRAAMPARRPGDPPAAPAELFVETTAETPALTPELLGVHDRARAAAEPADGRTADGRATDGRATDGRATEAASDAAGPRRVLGVPVPALPAWATRWLPAAKAEPGPAAAGHGHGHGPARPAGRRVRILIAALLVPCALATLVGLALLWPTGGPPATTYQSAQEQVRAQVTATRPTDCTPGSGNGGCVALVVHMADGPRPGRDLIQVVPVEPGTPQFAVGDRVVLGWSGADPEDAGSYQVIDFQRDTPLWWLAGLFAVAVLALGRWRGLAALAALGLSFVVLLFFVVPAILAGRDPLAVAVVGSCLIMFAVLYLTHGPSARTSTAVLGTLLSLALIGALGAGFSAAARLTGLDDQTSNLIATLGTGVDARGLLLAGVVIGALGVLDDVTVTQTSAVWELRYANPALGARGLFTSAMRIGRDHVASAVNTLVLAYAGAALPLLLLFSVSGRGFGEVVTSQDVATEIVRTLVGSIGLVASVPITTALAAAVAARETVPAADEAP